jgi:enoyl reductase-like protein
MPDVHSAVAAAFLEEAIAPLAIASGRGATLCSLDASFVAAAQQLGLQAELLAAGGKPVSD